MLWAYWTVCGITAFIWFLKITFKESDKIDINDLILGLILAVCGPISLMMLFAHTCGSYSIIKRDKK